MDVLLEIQAQCQGSVKKDLDYELILQVHSSRHIEISLTETKFVCSFP